MKTRTTLLAILLLLPLYSTFSQIKNVKTDRELDRLRGPVKRVELYRVRIDHYIPQNDEYPNSVRPSEWTEYDRTGKQIEYGPLCGALSNVPPGHSTQGFDETRNLLIETSYDHRNRITSKSIWQYDSEGREVSFHMTDAEGHLKYKWIYAYDAAGNKTDMALYVGEELQRRVSYSYNERGLVAIYSSYRADGSLINREGYSYIYDEQGNWVRRVVSHWVAANGEADFKPEEIENRKITYFEEK
jgi:hypothetical protein